MIASGGTGGEAKKEKAGRRKITRETERKGKRETGVCVRTGEKGRKGGSTYVGDEDRAAEGRDATRVLQEPRGSYLLRYTGGNRNRVTREPL